MTYCFIGSYFKFLIEIHCLQDHNREELELDSKLNEDEFQSLFITTIGLSPYKCIKDYPILQASAANIKHHQNNQLMML